MLENHRFLAVVPARGGSKAVPRKNIRPLSGKPLILHTLEQVEDVPEIDLLVVSTDDEEIADVATKYGTRVIQRPSALAGDTAPTEWALLHALEVLEEERQFFDYIIVLEPTSPFRRPQTITACMKKISASDGDSLMTVIETRSNIGRVEDGIYLPIIPGLPRRRQERQPLYFESSTVYVARVDYLRRTGTLVSDNWLAITVDDLEAVDINTQLDFDIAEAIARRYFKGRDLFDGSTQTSVFGQNYPQRHRTVWLCSFFFASIPR